MESTTVNVETKYKEAFESAVKIVKDSLDGTLNVELTEREKEHHYYKVEYDNARTLFYLGISYAAQKILVMSPE